MSAGIGGLIGTAMVAAQELLKTYPNAKFLSGRRSIAEQAASMAKNIVRDPSWLDNTYMKSFAKDMIEKWIEENPKLKKEEQIREGLLMVMNLLSYSQLSHLSKHLGGMAFDLEPGDEAFRVFVSNLAEKHGGKFLQKEGNLVIYHVQF